MSRSSWLAFVIGAALQAVIVGAVTVALYSGLDSSRQEVLAEAASAAGGVLILGAVGLAAALLLAVWLMYRRYAAPLPAIAEQTRLIAMSNPRHRLGGLGGRSLSAVTETVDLLAEQFQVQGEEVEVRVREANAALEEEKNTLAALMAKLTQGVVVCTPQGRIILYNQRAQVLLEGPARATGGGDWIGLGRSIFGVVEEGLLNHAFAHIQHRLADGDGGDVLVPFLISRPDGQRLSAHLVPILDHDRSLRGAILTVEDITRQIGAESRQGAMLKSLTEGQRSAIASVRAAVETILSFPDLDDAGRQQFLEVIRDEAVKMSTLLDQLEADAAAALPGSMVVQMLGSDFLAAVERAVREAQNVDLEVSAPVEPIWLRVDSYSLIQCLTFVIEQLRQWCRATGLRMTIAQRRALAAIEVEWTGAVLHMEALQAWGKRNVPIDAAGGTLSLFEAVERHGGAFWPDRTASGRPCLRLVLPVEEHASGPVGFGDDAADDFDFHLFDDHAREGAPLETPLARAACTVLDTETTGLDPSAGDEIIAIGAVRVVNGRILHREIFDSFVRPRRPIGEAAQAIHGISAAMLRAEPPIEEVMPKFRRFVEDTCLVGHNISFDLRFFELQGRRLGVDFANPVIDTLVLECLINPAQEDKSLEGIAARLGINVTGRHTALGDALTTAEIFLALIPLLAERGIHTLGDAARACAESRLSQMRY